ncbi:MAG: branched-chain amino acid ABC transporter permease [Candidatus Omnitrophica bacterium]|nr:branched-chain amino acid ABC transporter permease [Candidatus Omnitrophota bacterium]
MKKIPILLFLIVLPFIDTNQYHIDVMTTAGIYVTLALGLNVVVGFAGLLNLGYAAFFAIGAYTYALMNLYFRWPFWAVLPVSAVSGALFGVLLGFPTLRLRGDYLAIVTLGFGEIVRITFNNLEWTGGPNGLLGIAHPTLIFPSRLDWSHLKIFNFGVESLPYYYLVLGMVIVVAFLLMRLDNSRLGRAWIAIREDEVAAATMGIDPTRLKLLAFVIGSAIAGVAGCVFAGKQGTITPDSFDFILSVMLLAMVVLGGLGSIPGVIIGAIILSVLPELLRGFAIYRMLFFGLSMILIMLFRPQGIVGSLRRKMELKPSTEKIRLEEDEVLDEDRRK